MAKVTTKTKAIVLQTIKYGDSSLVVKMLTEESGLQSYMVKGVYGKKSKMKAALFQNMTLLDIVAENGNSSLGFIKEISLSYCYKSISTDIKKSTIIMFVSELLSKSIVESESDASLFNFIYNSMLWLDDAISNYANFPIVFAMKLSAYIGFFPNLENFSKGSCFNLLDGDFKNNVNDIYQIDSDLSAEFYELCRVSASSPNFNFSGSQTLNTRRQLLDTIIMYFKLHTNNTMEIRSVEILRSIF